VRDVPRRPYRRRRRAWVSDDEIDAARAATSADPHVAARLHFAIKVLTAHATVDDEDVIGLLAHDYSKRDVLEVVGIVALNQLTGSFNLVAGL